MRIAFLLYPTTKVKVDEDSSFWIMWELSRRGHTVYYFEPKDLLWESGRLTSRLTRAKLDPKKGYLPSPPEKNAQNLSSFDCIFIRKEPPFDIGYLTALQMLENIKGRVFILNDPTGMAISNEKLLSLTFEKYAPETLVTQNPAEAKRFIGDLKKPVALKPLDEKSGVGIFATGPNDKNLPSLLDTATQFGQKNIVVQRFVPVDRYGDKRILILNGESLGAFLRRPPKYDFRANLSVGGSMHRAKLTRQDKKLVEFLAPTLISRGLYFVGIDVIGKYLTEVNVTSPAGIPEINHFNGTCLEKNVVDFIEKKLAGRKRFLR